MAEETIAEHRFRRRVRDWSAICDNVLKLDRTNSLADAPMRLNQFGICAPPCEMCITPPFASDVALCDIRAALSDYMDLPDGDLLLPRSLTMRLISVNEIKVVASEVDALTGRALNDTFFKPASTCRPTLKNTLSQAIPPQLSDISFNLILKQNDSNGTGWSSDFADSGLNISRSFRGSFGFGGSTVERTFDASPQVQAGFRFNHLCQLSSGIAGQYVTRNDVYRGCGTVACNDYYSDFRNIGAALFDISERFQSTVNHVFPQQSLLTAIGDNPIDTTRSQSKRFIDGWVHVDGLNDVFASHTWRPFKLTMGTIGYKYSTLHSIVSNYSIFGNTDSYNPCAYYLLWEITG